MITFSKLHLLAVAAFVSFNSLVTASTVTLVPQEQAIANYMVSDPDQGRPSLTLDPTIEAVARARAKDMAERGYFSHVNPDGVAANYLLRQAGYVLPAWWGTDPTANYVESIAAGYADPSATWTAWMNSPDHKVHLLGQNSFYATETCYGVGYYYDPNSQYKYYWVVITAPPQPTPALSISTPAAAAIVTSDSVTVGGATDPTTNPAMVQYRVENTTGTSDYQAATGVTSWTGTVSGLAPGANVIHVQSLDASSNVIADATRNVTYVVQGTLSVLVSGSGSVTGAYSGITTQGVGETLTVTATPAAGYIFAGWTGSVEASSAAITFVMQDGDSLQATFIPNPFGSMGGSYYGILTSGSGSQSGLMRMALTSKGRFTGRVTVDGLSYAFAGSLDSTGAANVTVARPGLASLTIAVQADLSGSGEISGTVSDGTNTFNFNDSESAFNSKTNVAPQAGRYTLVLAANPNLTGSSVPQGDGYAAVVVGANGAATLAGRLADGTPYTATGYVTGEGTLAVYCVPTGAKAGSSVNGLLTFRATDVSDIDGTITWTKTANAADPFYPAGFVTELPSVGSHYVRPVAGLQAMNVMPGAATAGFGGGNIEAPLNVPVMVSQSEKATMVTPGATNVTLSINAISGAVSGSFVLPNGNVSRGIRGVVFQKQQAAYGFFRGIDQCGYFSLTQG